MASDTSKTVSFAASNSALAAGLASRNAVLAVVTRMSAPTQPIGHLPSGWSAADGHWSELMTAKPPVPSALHWLWFSPPTWLAGLESSRMFSTPIQ